MKILTRKRLHKIQKEMSSYSFTYIYAPWGYGKSTWKQAIMKDFLKEEVMVKELSSYQEVDLKNVFSIHEDYYFIIDDVMEAFPMELKGSLPSNIHFIIFSEQEPESFFYRLINDGLCLWIESDTLRFTKSEIVALWQLHHKQLKISEVEQILHDTNGWASALMIRVHSFSDLQSFAYMKEAYLHTLTTKEHRFLCKLSIVPSFTKDQALYITHEAQTHEMLKRITHTSGVLQKEQDKYRFLPIFRDAFLDDMRLLHMPKMTYYKRCAQWFQVQKHYLDAFHLYFELRDYDHIYEMVETCDHYLLEELEEAVIEHCLMVSKNIIIKYPHAYLIFLCGYIFYIDAEKGNQYLQEFKSLIELKLKEPEHSIILGEAFICEGYLHMNNFPVSGYYNFQAFSLLDGKIYNRFNSALLKTSGSYQILFQYYKKVGEFSTMYEELYHRCIMYHEMTNFANTSFIFQVVAEHAYEVADYAKAITSAQDAIQCVDRKREFSLYISALFILGKASIMEHKETIFHKVIKEIYRLTLEITNHKMKQMVLSVQAQLALMSNHPKWVDSSFDHLIEHNFHGTFVCNVQQYITVGKVAVNKKDSVTLRKLILPLNKLHNFSNYVFVSLYIQLFKIFLALPSSPKQACHMLQVMLTQSEKDNITSIYLEFSSDLYPLLQTLERSAYVQDLLDKMERIFIFHQKSGALYSSLTPKEYQVYLYWLDGLSRVEIAELLAISVNTVKYHLKNIYKALNIHHQRDLLKHAKKQRSSTIDS